MKLAFRICTSFTKSTRCRKSIFIVSITIVSIIFVSIIFVSIFIVIVIVNFRNECVSKRRGGGQPNLS